MFAKRFEKQTNTIIHFQVMSLGDTKSASWETQRQLLGHLGVWTCHWFFGGGAIWQKTSPPCSVS